MEKEDLIEALATELLERKALDLILASADYEDYELERRRAGGARSRRSRPQAVPEDQAKRPDDTRRERRQLTGRVE